ncbi:acetyltransferase, GNAT family [Thermoascus aurantiacus ATCC 26904]
MPIRRHPLTNEPYLRLPAPHADIILTPPRPAGSGGESDECAFVTILNDPRVYPFLESTPVPYLPEHAASFLREKREERDQILKDVEAGRKFVDGCPFRCIRQMKKKKAEEEGDEDGEIEGDVLIGDIGITRCAFYELPPGSEERREAQDRNKALPVGSRDIVWGIGNFLSPSHHGRGIMTVALRTLIEEWAVPRVNARVIKASAYVGNVGSVRVFEKNGFQMEHTLEDWAIVPENRGGGRKSIHVLRWEAPE